MERGRHQQRAGRPGRHAAQRSSGVRQRLHDSIDIAATAGWVRPSWSPATNAGPVGVYVGIVSAAGTPIGPIAVSGRPHERHRDAAATTSGGWWVVSAGPLGVRRRARMAAGVSGAPMNVADAVCRHGDRRPTAARRNRRSSLAAGRRRPRRAVGRAAASCRPHHDERGTDRAVVQAAADPRFRRPTTAVLETLDRQRLVVRRLGAELGPPIEVRHSGRAIDVAVDASRHTIEILSDDVEAFGTFGDDRLTAVGTHAQHSFVLHRCGSLALAGQVLADHGVTGISCASDDTEDVDTIFEGYGKLGRHDIICSCTAIASSITRRISRARSTRPPERRIPAPLGRRARFRAALSLRTAP